MTVRDRFRHAHAALWAAGLLIAFATGWIAKPGPYHTDRVLTVPGPTRVSTDPARLIRALGEGQIAPADSLGLPPAGGTCHAYMYQAASIIVCVP